MNYSVLRKFLSTTSLVAVAATISACSGEMERWSSPGFEGYTPNQKEIFTNSTTKVPLQTAANQQMPAAVMPGQQVRYQSPVYTSPTNVPVVAARNSAPLVTNSVQTAVRTPVQSYPMPAQVSNTAGSVPVYSAVPVATNTANYRYPSSTPNVDYTSTGSIASGTFNKPPVVVSSFHSMPKSAPRVKNAPQTYASVPAVSSQRMPVYVPVAAQPMPPKPVQEKSRFSIAKFFSLPKTAPKTKAVDYGTTASITPPAMIPSGSSVSGRQQVAPSTINRFQNTQSARTSGNWTSAGGSMVTVRSGETIQVLSRRYGVPSKAIADVNGLVDQSYVAPGQQLLIPVYQQAGTPSYQSAGQQTAAVATSNYVVPAVLQVPKSNPLRLQSQSPYGQKIIRMQQTANAQRRHMVMPGDSLGGIASRYNVTVASLAQANGLSTNSPVRMGQRLHIPQPGAAANGVDYTTTASINRQPVDMNSAGNQAMPPLVRVSRIPKAKPRQTIPSSLAIMKSQPTGNIVSLPKAKAKRQRVAALQQPVGLPTGVTNDAAPVSRGVVSTSNNKSSTAATGNAGAPKFRWPVRGRIISNYGRKRDGGRNDGINLSVPTGTSVRVAESGTVIYSGSKLKGYGNLVLVQHSNGWVTAYAHNEKILVSKGQQVRRGQIISQAGNSGNVDSPQLHFELRIKGDPVDPVPYLISS
ncbi:peptidoglycan DD-metalloendopeptidase family protein [Cohaesibacter celericrescens]|uniref:peptidoglycan DD-metalloendopeptidase family protein n=1 Tax=Cohaesibacter celericrescens TaxID=2067669 RepID=UPI00356958C9